MRTLTRSTVLLASAGLAMQANAETKADAAMATVHTMAKSMHLGVEYRAGMDFHDNGFDETDTADASSETLITLHAFRVKLKGDLSDDADYFFRFDPTADPGKQVQYAKVNWWLTKMFGLTVGRDKAKQNGWENYRSTYDGIMDSHYHDFLKPFSTYADTVTLTAKVAGTISLQLLNDLVSEVEWDDADGDDEQDAGEVTVTGVATHNESNKQPAWILEWIGDFGGVKPLVQIGSYDLNHSMYAVVSGQYQAGPVDAALTIVSDMRRTPKATDPEEDDTTTITSIAAEGAFKAGVWRPFAKITHLDVKQPGTDAKANSSVGSFDDNGMIIHVGTYGPEQGDFLRPYVALTHNTGKFLDAAGEEESKSEMSLHAGITGEI